VFQIFSETEFQFDSILQSSISVICREDCNSYEKELLPVHLINFSLFVGTLVCHYTTFSMLLLF